MVAAGLPVRSIWREEPMLNFVQSLALGSGRAVLVPRLAARPGPSSVRLPSATSGGAGAAGGEAADPDEVAGGSLAEEPPS